MDIEIFRIKGTYSFVDDTAIDPDALAQIIA